MKNTVTAFMVTLILAATLIMAFGVRPVKASGTIYIRADGSIDPPTANITSADNFTYTFTDNNYDSIVVERGNIVIDGAGYTLQGAGIGIGIDLSGIHNVTIKNTNIRSFLLGIGFSESSYNNISRNNITANNGNGIHFQYSSNNGISSNNITANKGGGIYLLSSLYTSISGNNIRNNMRGIYLSWYSHYGSIAGNNITDNSQYGIRLYISSNNSIYHNNFVNNTIQVYTEYSLNIWDDGYPSGGNYWSDYTDVDSYKGQHQNETGGDGVWDNPYVIDGSNQDGYPLTKPYGGPAVDVDGDRDVDIFDIVRMAGVYDVKYPNPLYDRLCDMDLDGDIDIFDIVAAASHYGESW